MLPATSPNPPGRSQPGPSRDRQGAVSRYHAPHPPAAPPTRREILLGSLSLALAGCSTSPAPPKRPNILFAFSDDQSYPHASILGDPVVKTPAFDRVAREGVLFTHSFTACPSCTPARASVLTGRQMWQTGEGGVLYGTLDPRYPLFTHLLEDAGYHVGFTGKGFAPGDWKAGGVKRPPLGAEYNDILAGNPPAGIDKRDYAKNFEAFLADRQAGAPFFYWFGCTEPHRDYKPGIGQRSGMNIADVPVPPYFPDAEEVRQEILDYYYEIQHFDTHLGRMLAKLEELGELDNTIVVVTSDNGMPFVRTKTTLYDGGVRMPTAIRWGREAPAGRSVDDFISHIDFAATFLEAAGVDIPVEFTGRSLMPLLKTAREGRIEDERDHVVTGLERHTWCRPEGAGYPIRAIRTHDYLYVRNFEPDRWPSGDPDFTSSNKAPYGDIDDGLMKDFMLRPETRRDFPREYQLSIGKRPAEELYVIASDPHQIDNRADDPEFAEVKKKLWARLESYLKETADPRMEDRDPWQGYVYRQQEGYGATFNRSLSAEERKAALSRGKHAVGHANEVTEPMK